jgi:uncharacterized protein (TIGR00251 family)
MQKPDQPEKMPRCKLSVKVIPSAPGNRIIGFRNSELVVKVAAAPQKGKANKELIVFLAQELGIPKRDIEILAGSSSQHKVLQVRSDAYAKLMKTHGSSETKP